MRDDLMEELGLGIGGIEIGRVDVARHHPEQLDILLGQDMGDARAVAERDLVEGAVLDEGFVGHGLDPVSGASPAAGR